MNDSIFKILNEFQVSFKNYSANNLSSFIAPSSLSNNDKTKFCYGCFLYWNNFPLELINTLEVPVLRGFLSAQEEVENLIYIENLVDYPHFCLNGWNVSIPNDFKITLESLYSIQCKLEYLKKNYPQHISMFEDEEKWQVKNNL